MPSDLIALLMEWIGKAFCWIIDSVLAIVLLIVAWMVETFMPAYPVPDWLGSLGNIAPVQSLQFLAWVMPVGIIFWASGIWLAYEVVMAVALPLYRMVMDLF